MSNPVMVMVYALLIGAVAFVIGLLWARPLISWLKQHKIGKRIREEGPASHAVKAGTPTMGGIHILITALVVTIPFNLFGRLSMLLPLGVIAAMATLGVIDDWRSLTGRKQQGLTARVKFGWQFLIAVVAALVLYYLFGYQKIHLPFVGGFSIGAWYIPIAVFIIVGSANAVNLTDGLDTLAAGTLALAFSAYGIIAYGQGQPFLVTFCFTIVGAILAFLWFNAHPAEIFMGDTGSLALGALLGLVALMTGHWLILPVIGVIFVAVAVSVILQVGYFKLTKGKRIFKMAPLHHHFEAIGWSETQVAMRFWVIAIVGAMVGIALALSVPG